jgi:predicted nucleic acid-binding protein
VTADGDAAPGGGGAVLDASALAAWLLPDEVGPDLAPALAEGAHAPALVWTELLNILLVAERRGRLGEAEADALLDALGRVGLATDDARPGAAVTRLARTHGLTAYDATYLELALRLGAPLATLDRALARAAEAEGVRVLGGA